MDVDPFNTAYKVTDLKPIFIDDGFAQTTIQDFKLIKLLSHKN